ncbi:UNVERIFIED_CONTAM: hypothetical protein FKN15_001661 [Acipenser sinensis]
MGRKRGKERNGHPPQQRDRGSKRVDPNLRPWDLAWWVQREDSTEEEEEQWCIYCHQFGHEEESCPEVNRDTDKEMDEPEGLFCSAPRWMEHEHPQSKRGQWDSYFDLVETMSWCPSCGEGGHSVINCPLLQEEEEKQHQFPVQEGVAPLSSAQEGEARLPLYCIYSCVVFMKNHCDVLRQEWVLLITRFYSDLHLVREDAKFLEVQQLPKCKVKSLHKNIRKFRGGEQQKLPLPPPPGAEQQELPLPLPPPPAEGEYLLVALQPPWEDCLPLPPPPAEGEYLLVALQPPWEDCLPLPPPPADSTSRGKSLADLDSD